MEEKIGNCRNDGLNLGGSSPTENPKLNTSINTLDQIQEELDLNMRAISDLYTFVSGKTENILEPPAIKSDGQLVGILEITKTKVFEVRNAVQDLTEITGKLVNEFK